jgi:hypothetical protein
MAPRQQNLSEEEILSLYSAEKKGNQNITRYQKYANPVHRTLYGQAIKLKQILFTYQDTIKDLTAILKINAEKAA